jgi:hypothetical protein
MDTGGYFYRWGVNLLTHLHRVLRLRSYTSAPSFLHLHLHIQVPSIQYQLKTAEYETCHKC